MPDYCYEKHYSANAFGSMVLDNPEPLDAFNVQKYNALIDTFNSAGQREVKLEFLRQFKEICEYDILHAVCPDQFGYFENEDEKAEFRRISLLNQNCVNYLGSVFAGYHRELMKKNLHQVPELSAHVIDFMEVFRAAYADYAAAILGLPRSPRFIIKNAEASAEPITEQAVAYTGEAYSIPSKEPGKKVQRPPHAITATYVYPALVEQAISMYAENSIIYKWIDGLDDMALDEDEKKLHAAHKRMREQGRGLITGDRRKMLRRIWDIGEKYGVLADAGGMKRIMYGKNGGDDLTLGDILSLKYTESQIRPEYLDVLRLLFGRKNLNIRNRIAHGDKATFDYLHVGYVAIMHQIMLDIARDDVFYMKGRYCSPN